MPVFIKTSICSESALSVARAEEVVVFTAGAVNALQAADQQQGHAHRNQNGEGVSVNRKPM
jgi:hypothetical protein